MHRSVQKAGKLSASTRPADGFASSELERLFALFSSHYDNVSYDRFLDDLAHKDEVIVLHDADGRLQGFSTLVVWPVTVDRKPVRIVFSGDTVIDHAYWGSSALAFEWLRITGEIYARRPGVPLYWLLCSKSPRTYRYLSQFYRTFYPDGVSSGTEREARIAAEVCAARFPERYDRAANVVRSEPGSAFLRPEFAESRDAILSRADIDHYKRLNPGHEQGDELACVALISPENHQPAARRRFERALEPVGA